MLMINQLNKKKKQATELSSQAPWGALETIPIALGIYLGSNILAGIFFVVTGLVDFDKDLTLENLFALSTFSLAMTVLLTLIALNIYKNSSVKNLGFTKKNLSKIWYVVPAFLFYFLLSSIGFIVLDIFVSEEVLNQDQDLGFEGPSSALQYIYAFLLLVVIAPVLEELVFRGILFKGLLNIDKYTTNKDLSIKLKKHAPVFAIVVSSILFGIAHGQLNLFVDTAILGAVLAWLMYKTDNIYIPMVLHSTKNFLAFLLLFVFDIT